MNNGSNSNNFKTAMFADCLANSKEIFQLIDQVFPLDSCRYYEVLPLKLFGNDLTLGMLDPRNEDSIKFVNSIAKVFKYNLEIQLIDLQTHQIILANYPQNSPPAHQRESDQNKTIIDTNFNPNAPLKGIDQRRMIDSAPTIISQPEETSRGKFDLDPELPELPDLPPDLDFLKDLELTPKRKNQGATSKADANATLFEIPPEFLPQKAANNLDDKATIIAGNPAELLAQETSQVEPEIDFDEAQISQLIAETLGKISPEKIQPETADFLPQLILIQLSWQSLLEAAFKHHTEYIILTPYSDRGSIVAQKNKLTQSQIEEVSLPIFCSLIDEIKRMARLPLNTAAHPKKVVFERFHHQERILLRLEFELDQERETVGIQILRDQALKIYEQQQLDRVSEQALQLAKQLEKTLRRIQASFDSAELSNLRELQNVHSRINHQLRLLDKP
jgi:hypothetical protein